MPRVCNQPSIHIVLLTACITGMLAFSCQVNLAAAEERLPAPTEEQQQELEELIREVYEGAFEDARSDEQKLELAEMLLTEGQGTLDDPSARFVLFTLARDIATEAANLQVAFPAIDELSEYYEIDGVGMKTASAQAVLEDIRRPNDRPTLDAMISTISGMVNEAVSAGRFEDAQQVMKNFVDAARRSRSQSLQPAVNRLHALEAIATQYASLEYALSTLQEDPIDADANLLVGKFRCFVLEDWTGGLPLLALGNDEKLVELATAELNTVLPVATFDLDDEADDIVIDPRQLKSVGDGWWDYSETLVEAEQAPVLRRAAHWYLLAQPLLSGLALSQVEHRLEEAESVMLPYETQTFDNEAAAAAAGWRAFHSGQYGCEFGFSDSNYTGGASRAGEGGGTFNRVLWEAYYADTTLQRELTLDDALMGSGEFSIGELGFNNTFRLGHLSTESERDQYCSIGVAISNSRDGESLVVEPRIYLSNRRAYTGEPFSVPANARYRWWYEWVPSSSTLNIELFNYRGESMGRSSLRLAPDVRATGLTLDAFGLSVGGVDRYGGEEGETVDAYIDDVNYTAR